MAFRWSIAPPQDLITSRLEAELKIGRLLAQCLANRGFSESAAAAAFLEPRLKNLSDPFLLPNMEAAVERLFQARARSESVVIFGDYDVDGVTSTALLSEVMATLGWKTSHYLPHRMEEGYGLSAEGVEKCLRQFPVSLLLAVDCGSSERDLIAALESRGIDVIVLDHHQVSNPAPPAKALVNPQLAPLGEPCFRHLCSAGLAFKLAHALVKKGRQAGLAQALDFDLRPLLDLVALGIVADLVPVTGENRTLLVAGLDRLNRTERPGLRALRDTARIQGPIGAYEIGFQLGPRLNAAGRLETARAALDLLLTRDPQEAAKLASLLDTQNRERQRIENAIVEQVTGAIQARFDPATDYVIVEGQLLWHIGVVGIVASRVLRTFHRPALILGGDGKEWRGSGRSIEGFDLAAALRACDDLLIRHGGHALAAGLSMHPDKIDQLRFRLNQLAKGQLDPELLKPALKLDAVLELEDLTFDLLAELKRLAPHGQENPPVHLMFPRVSLRPDRPPRRVGKNERHLKMWVTDGRVTHQAIWWNFPDREAPEGEFDLAAMPQMHEYNGFCSIQLKVLDWRPVT